MTYTPRSRSASAMATASCASGNMTGMMACSPGSRSKPAASIRSRKSRALRHSVARCSAPPATRSRATLWRNARDFRERMEAAGFDLLPGEHAIIPVMFPDAHDAVAIADALLERGVYVIPFSYPVVPLGKARIRVQISAGHSADDIATCVQAFVEARDAVRAPRTPDMLSLIHISEPTRRTPISYAVFCLKKKK